MPHDSVIVTSHDTIPDFAAHPTIISVNDGNWADPSTWDLGRVPGETDIVSVAHVVNYDGDGTADVIGVTGTLRFGEDSHLLVTTLLSKGGTIDLGTACEIVIRDTPLDTTPDGIGTFDPYQFGHGILCIDGQFLASGQPKMPFARSDVFAPDWDAGDRVVLPDVRPVNTGFEQCEVVAYGSPWQFGHTGGHIANLTRSIVIRSENPLGTRGHVMCMGSCKPELRYVCFKDLGRTKASRLQVTLRGGPDTAPVYSIGSNVPGRYSLHLHHLTSVDWLVEGCVFDGFLRWALAVHDTHYGIARGNVAFDGDGAAFVQEDGSESGNVWDGNIAILLRGSGDSPVAAGSGNPTRNWLADTGHEGVGFWQRAGRGSWINNVAANCAWAGWNTFSRAGHVGKPLPVMVPKSKGGPKIAFDARWSVPTAFGNNEVYASHRGFEWWYAWASVMDNCRVWNCVNKDLFFTYHGSALVDDTAIVGGSDGILGQHGTHLRAKRVTIDGAAIPFTMEPNKKGILFEDVTFDGVEQPSPPYKPILDIEPAIDSAVSGIVALKFPGITAGSLVVAVNGKKLASDSSSPYSVNWNTANYPNGTAWVTAELGSDVAFFVGRYFVEN